MNVTIYHVEYFTGGAHNQVLGRFTNEAAANAYLDLMTQDPSYRSHFTVVPVLVFETLHEYLDSNPPVCQECGMEGHVVETITDMLVWHHVEAEVEDRHDFEPADGRPQILRPFIDTP